MNKPYSVSAHEQREQNAAAGKPKKRKPTKNRDIKLGRKTDQAKLRAAVRTEHIFPSDFAKSDCILAHTRPIWRLRFRFTP